jgi:hypothetical protein
VRDVRDAAQPAVTFGRTHPRPAGLPTVSDLGRRECWRLLGLPTFARVAYAFEGQPRMTTVNYTLDGRSIVFRTVEGFPPHGMRDDMRIVFEADAHNDRCAWCVTIMGPVREVSDRADIGRCARLPLLRWVEGQDVTYFRVVPRSVTGRRYLRAYRPPLDEPSGTAQ